MAAATRRWLAWALLGTLCALVFAAYLHPDFAFAVANRIWSCF